MFQDHENKQINHQEMHHNEEESVQQEVTTTEEQQPAAEALKPSATEQQKINQQNAEINARIQEETTTQEPRE